MMYLGVYSGIGISACFSEVVRELALFVSCVRASKVIHERLLHRIFRTPMSFFDTNPIGRIVNRYATGIRNWALNLNRMCLVLQVLVRYRYG